MLAALILILAVTLYRVLLRLRRLARRVGEFLPTGRHSSLQRGLSPAPIYSSGRPGTAAGADLILNVHYHQPLIDTGMFSRYFCFGLILLLGRPGPKTTSHKLLFLFASTLIGSALFYLMTNTTTWISTADYAKTLPGWWQAMTTGVPGFPPTLLFFRNTLLSDLFFTALFVITQASFHRISLLDRRGVAYRSP